MKTVGRTFPVKKPEPARKSQGNTEEGAKAPKAETKSKTPKKGT